MDKLVEYDSKDKPKTLGRDDIKIPDGWLWQGDWTIDKSRAVDEHGKVLFLRGVH